MVFGGKFRIRRCNSKASYLPRQSLEKLNSTDPDHGSYKLTLTSNEDLVVAHTKPTILTHNGKMANNLPDVLPLGAKLQPPQQQPNSPTNSLNGGSPLRYGSNNNIAHSNSPNQQQNCYPMYPSQHRYSTPTMGSYSNVNVNGSNNNNNYTRSQSFETGGSNTGNSPTKFMSQSTIDLKKTPHGHLEPTMEEASMEISSKVLSPAHSENNLSSPTQHASKSGGNTDTRQDASEGRIFRAELVNTTLSSSPCGKPPLVTRKESLRENIEKITQLQSKLMSAHFADPGGILSSSGYTAKTTIKYLEQDELQANKENVEHSIGNPDAVNTTSESSSPPLPGTPPPPLQSVANDDDHQANEEGDQESGKDSSVSTSTDTSSDALVLAQISQMDKNTDGLKLMQRSEIVLRVNPTTMETASQTDDLPDGDMGRLTVQQHAKEETQRRVTLQPRQRHPIEVDCDNLAKELVGLLAPSDRLIDVLQPQIVKSPTDYVEKLFNPDVPLRPTKRDVGTSTLMRMKSQHESAERNAITVELQSTDAEVALTNGSDTDSCDLIKSKVNDLIRHLHRKITLLSKEQTTIGEEAAVNDELATSLIAKLADKVRPIEATKFRTYIDDVGHITSLLLSLSERLARTENCLSSLNEGDATERKPLEVKRDSLLEQLDEAKRLKEDIDRRGCTVTGLLERNLTVDEVADFDYFINMKAKLIADARDIADKIKWGEEQLTALNETLLQSDC